MRASDVAQHVPVFLPHDSALAGIRQVAQEKLPCLVLKGAAAGELAVLSRIDLLELIVPEYFHESLALASTLDEQSADRVAQGLTGVSLRQLLRTHHGVTARVPADATLVEVAERMVSVRRPVLLVGGTAADHHTAPVPVVTAERVIKALCLPVTVNQL